MTETREVHQDSTKIHNKFLLKSFLDRGIFVDVGVQVITILKKYVRNVGYDAVSLTGLAEGNFVMIIMMMLIS
jgi:hypothetical protein